MTVGNEMMNIQARYLKLPELCFGKRNGPRHDFVTLKGKPHGTEAAWDLRGKKFFKVEPGAFALSIIKIRDSGGWSVEDSEVIDVFVDNFTAKLGSYGLTVNQANPIADAIHGNRDQLARNLDNACNQFGTPPLVIVLLPSKDARTYGNVKWWADCVRGVPTLCVTKEKLRKNCLQLDKSGGRIPDTPIVPKPDFTGNLRYLRSPIIGTMLTYHVVWK
jgi:hypothetical protein